MAEKDNPAAEETGGKSKLAIFDNKAVLLGVIVVVQTLVAIGLTQFFIMPRLGVQGADMAPAQVEESKEQMPEMGVLLGLEEIIVTLDSDPRKPRYLRINVNLELKNQIAADIAGQRLPQLRDIVIMTLSDVTAEQLVAPAGKKGLRDEIFRRIDAKMPSGVLLNVFFSDLVVQ